MWTDIWYEYNCAWSVKIGRIEGWSREKPSLNTTLEKSRVLPYKRERSHFYNGGPPPPVVNWRLMLWPRGQGQRVVLICYLRLLTSQSLLALCISTQYWYKALHKKLFERYWRTLWIVAGLIWNNLCSKSWMRMRSIVDANSSKRRGWTREKPSLNTSLRVGK